MTQYQLFCRFLKELDIQAYNNFQITLSNALNDDAENDDMNVMEETLRTYYFNNNNSFNGNIIDEIKTNGMINVLKLYINDIWTKDTNCSRNEIYKIITQEKYKSLQEIIQLEDVNEDLIISNPHVIFIFEFFEVIERFNIQKEFINRLLLYEDYYGEKALCDFINTNTMYDILTETFSVRPLAPSSLMTTFKYFCRKANEINYKQYMDASTAKERNDMMNQNNLDLHINTKTLIDNYFNSIN